MSSLRCDVEVDFICMANHRAVLDERDLPITIFASSSPSQTLPLFTICLAISTNLARLR